MFLFIRKGVQYVLYRGELGIALTLLGSLYILAIIWVHHFSSIAVKYIHQAKIGTALMLTGISYLQVTTLDLCMLEVAQG